MVRSIDRCVGVFFLWMVASVLAGISNNAVSQENPTPVSGPQQRVHHRGINVNILVDGVLRAAREAILASNEDTLELPDLTEDFYESLWPFVVHGHLHCTKGSVRSLSSVKRTGDARLEYHHGKIIVVSELGLKTLIVNYTYDASILHMGATGDLRANVTSNSATLAASLSYSPKGCVLKMQELNITDIGHIDVSLTGLYPFDGLSSAIASKAADSLQDTIKKAAEDALREHIQEVIDKVPCHV